MEFKPDTELWAAWTRAMVSAGVGAAFELIGRGGSGGSGGLRDGCCGAVGC